MQLRQGNVKLLGSHRWDLVSLGSVTNLPLHAITSIIRLSLKEGSGEARHQFIARIAD